MSDIYVDNISHFGLAVYFDMLCDLSLFDKIHQRNCIKFCIKNLIKFPRYLKCSLAFGATIVNRTQVNRFKVGREDVNDDAHPGRPSTSTTDINIEEVNKMILDKRQMLKRLVMMLAYRSSHAKQFLRMFLA